MCRDINKADELTKFAVTRRTIFNGSCSSKKLDSNSNFVGSSPSRNHAKCPHIQAIYYFINASACNKESFFEEN